MQDDAGKTPKAGEVELSIPKRELVEKAMQAYANQIMIEKGLTPINYEPEKTTETPRWTIRPKRSDRGWSWLGSPLTGREYEMKEEDATTVFDALAIVDKATAKITHLEAALREAEAKAALADAFVARYQAGRDDYEQDVALFEFLKAYALQQPKAGA